MRIRVLVSSLVAAAALSLAGSAHAQATRTWVSGVGDDANPCSRTAPCKTWAGAISKTAAGGEIDALDPGGFGQITITKSITIDGRNTNASTLASAGTNGIVIAAAVTDSVTLRGMSIIGVGATLTGVKWTSGGTVHIEDCFISGFGTGGIDFRPGTGVSANLFVKRSTFNNDAGGGIITGGMGSPAVVIVKSHFFNDSIGLHATDGAHVAVSDTTFAGNTMYGVWAEGTAEVNMDRGLISANGVGVQGDSTVRLSEVLIGHNTTGLAGAKVLSFGNNRVAAGNATNGAPSSTLLQQ